MTIVCVAGYDVARPLLEEAGESLRGKTVVGISFVTPEQAGTLDELAESVDGRYLDLEILGYPSDVRGGSAFLYVSGDRAAFEDARPILERLGDVRYVNPTPGDAFISSMAVLLPYLPMAVGLFQGAAVCERRGLPLEWYADQVRAIYAYHLDELLETIVADVEPADPANVEASVRTWADGAADYAAYLESEGLDAGMYEAIHRLFEAEIEAGRGDHDWTSIGHVSADHPRV
jgi:3-hydroxyisobutyrate dehydrogenase-like beta-hydroxyacid dehydrogenase